MAMLPKLLIYRYQTRLKIKNPVIVRPPLIEYVCMIKNFNQSSMNYINQINMSRFAQRIIYINSPLIYFYSFKEDTTLTNSKNHYF